MILIQKVKQLPLKKNVRKPDRIMKLSISVDTFNSYKLDSYAAIDKAALVEESDETYMLMIIHTDFISMSQEYRHSDLKIAYILQTESSRIPCCLFFFIFIISI